MTQDIEYFISHKKFPPVLLMFGEEDFLLEEAFSSLISSIVDSEESKYNFDVFDGENSNIKDILDVCTSYPFIGDRRTVVVKNFQSIYPLERTKKGKKDLSTFQKYLESPNESTTLIITAELDKLNGITNDLQNAKKKDAAQKKLNSLNFPYNILFTNHKWVEFPKIYESELSKWIKKRVAFHEKEIDQLAVEFLLAQSSPSLRELNNEIEKVVIYISGRKKITLEDMNYLIGASRQFNVFELQKAVGERSLPKSLKILENMLAYSRQEMLIITMLTRYFVILWKLLEEKEQSNNNYTLAGAVGVSPFFIPEYLASLSKYKPEDLDKALKALTETDELLKSSSTDSLYLLQKMIINIISK
jgi:DNA polymerase III subunit delta